MICCQEKVAIIITAHNWQNKEVDSLKDYRYHDFPNTEFSYFLIIDIDFLITLLLSTQILTFYKV